MPRGLSSRQLSRVLFWHSLLRGGDVNKHLKLQLSYPSATGANKSCTTVIYIVNLSHLYFALKCIYCDLPTTLYPDKIKLPTDKSPVKKVQCFQPSFYYELLCSYCSRHVLKRADQNQTGSAHSNGDTGMQRHRGNDEAGIRIVQHTTVPLPSLKREVWVTETPWRIQRGGKQSTLCMCWTRDK